MSAVTMTWVKFEREVLPQADTIEVFVPASSISLVSLVTATNPDAPPIVQWDAEEQRNPVTWFFHSGKGIAHNWDLQANRFYPVPAIVLQPSMWRGSGFDHHGKAVYFLVAGAWDTRHVYGGGLFPEFLRAEYREIRATLEAHIQRSKIEGREQGTATGFLLKADNTKHDPSIHLRVTSNGGKTQLEYKLDRWD